MKIQSEKMRLLDCIEYYKQGDFYDYPKKFTWNQNEINNLIDSILKQYPIGFFVLEPVKKNKYEVLDGFNRIKIIGNVFCFVAATHDKEFAFCYDLKENKLLNQEAKESCQIDLWQIANNYAFLYFLRDLSDSTPDKNQLRIMIDKAKSLSKIVYDYEVNYYEVKGKDEVLVNEFLERINAKSC